MHYPYIYTKLLWLYGTVIHFGILLILPISLKSSSGTQEGHEPHITRIKSAHIIRLVVIRILSSLTFVDLVNIPIIFSFGLFCLAIVIYYAREYTEVKYKIENPYYPRAE